MKKGSDAGEMFDDFLHCVWMKAGVVDYKLCDRHFECDTCPLDAGIREAVPGRRQKAGPTSRVGGREPRGGDEGVWEVEGYLAPRGLFYHPRHAWVRIEEGGRARVGLDDFGQRLVGRVYSVGLPRVGSKVREGQPIWKVIHRAGETDLCAPLAGVVMEANDKLSQQPSLINRDSYGAGAAFVIQPTGLAEDLRNLNYGNQVERWFQSEVQELHRKLFTLAGSCSPILGQTIQDGGMPIEDLSSVIDPVQLQTVIAYFLSAREGPARRRAATEQE